MFKQNKSIFIMTAMILAMTLFSACSIKPLPNNGGGTSALRPIDTTDHVFGPLDAPVKMIVYSDFQCPFCAEFANSMKQVEQAFSDKVVIAFRHYPLAGHPEAAKAAEASECAAEQGKFWGMHDKLFADNVASRMGVEQFKQDAADLGLDQNKFNQCLDSGQSAAKVAEEMADGKKAGVTGTPTSFINGHIYPGAYPFEDFTASDGKSEKGLKSIINELLK